MGQSKKPNGAPGTPGKSASPAPVEQPAVTSPKSAATSSTGSKSPSEVTYTSSAASSNPPTAGAPPEAANREGIGFLGEVIWLMMYSPGHKHFFVTDMEWMTVPPVALRQFRLWRRNNLPVAYAAWGFVSAEVEARLMQGVRKLSPQDWKSGDRLWLIDLVVPFGGTEEVLKELREVVFKGQKAKTLRPSPEGMMVVGEV